MGDFDLDLLVAQYLASVQDRVDALESKFTDLKKPFSSEDVSWKPGQLTRAARDWKPGQEVTKDMKAGAMAYGDLRAYMYRLDEVCGANWQHIYVPWGNDRIICELTIFGITRSGTGEFDAGGKDAPEGTAAEAQAFKRACAFFGLGRYLYKLPTKWVPFDPARKTITDEGKAELDAWYVKFYAQAMARIAARVTEAAKTVSAPAVSKAPSPSVQAKVAAVVGKAEVKAEAIVSGALDEAQALVDAAGLTDQAVVTKSVETPAATPEPVKPEVVGAPVSAPASAPAAADGDAVWTNWKGISDAKNWGREHLSEVDVTTVWMEAFKAHGKFNKTNQGEVFATFVEMVNKKIGK